MKTQLLIAFSLLSAITSTAKIQGSLVHADSTISNAAVEVLNSDSIAIRSTLTNSNGVFEISTTPSDAKYIQFRATGFVPLCLSLPGNKDIDYGKISLTAERQELNEIVVTSNNIITVDKMTVYPNKTILKHSSSSLGVLNNLMLPGLDVNTVLQSATIYGKTVTFKINGIRRDIERVMSINPSDILKVEYSSSPSIREQANGVGGVINIILKPASTGVSGYESVFSAVTTKMVNENAGVTYNNNASELALSYNMQWRDYNKSYTNSTTQYLATEKAIERISNGKRGDLNMCLNNLQLSYTYTPNTSTVFSATLSHYFGPWEREAISDNTENINGVQTDNYKLTRTINQPYSRPALDLYFKKATQHSGTFELNSVTTYNHSKSDWSQNFEYPHDLLINYINNTRSNKWSTINEALWAKMLGKVYFKAGAKDSYMNTSNTYLVGDRHITEDIQSNTLLVYGELQGRVKKLTYNLGTGLYHYYVKHTDFLKQSKLRNYTVMRLMAAPQRSLYLRGAVKYSPQFAPLSNYSNALLIIDDLTASQGNPALKTASALEGELNITFTKNNFSADLRGYYGYTFNPIFNIVNYTDNRYVSQVLNSENYRCYNIGLNLKYQKMLKNKSFGGALYCSNIGQMNDISKLSGYSLNKWYYSAKAFMQWNAWSAEVSYNSPSYSLYGEVITKTSPYSNITLSYAWKTFNFSVNATWLGVSDGDYKRYVSLSNINPYNTVNVLKDNSNTIGVIVSYRFQSGRQKNGSARSLNNSDSQSGANLLN